MNEGKVTQALIAFALKTEYKDIPAAVIDKQKKSLIDSIGAISAATTLEPACEPIIRYAVKNSAEKSCNIIGTEEKASPVMAAMANGALIHALDYEDGHDESKAHPNTASIPTLIALSEIHTVSGREFLAAMAVASEAACRLKLALQENDLENGWYSPAMFSAYGAVLGGARVLGFSEEQTLDAISICLTQVMMPGQMARSGESCLRAVRDAFSAKAAMFSLMLAREGLQARMDEPFEGKLGLYHMIERGAFNPRVITDNLGKEWVCERLRYKLYPCCGTTHGAIYALKSLLEKHPAAPDEIRSINIEIDPIHLRVLEPRKVKTKPSSIAAAKFSMPFCLALCAAFGNVSLEMFSEEMLRDERILGLASIISYSIRQNMEKQSDDHIRITVETESGSFSEEVFVSPGAPELPPTEEEMKAKFNDCMDHAKKKLTDSDKKSFIHTVNTLEGREDSGYVFKNIFG